VIVSSKDEGPPARATEIVTGGMSTASTRRLASPVMHILDPPLIHGHVSSVGVTVMEVVSALSIPQTRGDPKTWATLMTIVGLVCSGHVTD
jgi:hypothetical protein